MKRWYLFPLSLIYHFVTALRNRLYGWGFFSSTSFSSSLIGVGNLSVGGSGKSPMVMYLADLLSKNFRTGVLSRGYGRKTKGYGIVNYESTYKMVGDEAMQLFERFRNRFVIGVCEDRVYGARKIIHDMDLEVLLLDDSFQHRKIKPGFNILLTDYNDPYFKDFLLPAGNLRESRRGAKRADLIVVTKCPEILTEEKKQYYLSRIKPKKNQKVFFSSIRYDENILNKRQLMPVKNLDYYEVLLVTGIANPTLIEKELHRYTSRIKHLQYRDHHPFSIEDIEEIKKEYEKLGPYKIILTTEKDYVRLKTFDYLREKLFYWPINMEIDRPEEFKQTIFTFIQP